MDRQRALRRAGAVVLLVNAVLLVAKGVVWYASGSLAVGSEAVNSLTDVVYSVVVLGGLYLTTQPPDLEHPHGHERIEPFVSLVIAAGIFLAAAVILVSAYRAIVTGEIAVATGPAAVTVLGAAAAAKYGLYRYCLAAGEATNSPALRASAIDNRNDILAALAALAGVAGAQAGYPVLDPVAAGVVAVAIGFTGVGIVRANFGYLVGEAPPEDLRVAIVQRALAHPDVEGVHEVIAHYVGPEIDVSLHIEVEGHRTILEAHRIETEVAEAIRGIDLIDDVYVHVDPKELGEWKDDPEVDRLSEQLRDDEAEG